MTRLTLASGFGLLFVYLADGDVWSLVGFGVALMVVAVRKR